MSAHTRTHNADCAIAYCLWLLLKHLNKHKRERDNQNESKLHTKRSSQQDKHQFGLNVSALDFHGNFQFVHCLIYHISVFFSFLDALFSVAIYCMWFLGNVRK